MISYVDNLFVVVGVVVRRDDGRGMAVKGNDDDGWSCNGDTIE
jgi:hypothetical protein